GAGWVAQNVQRPLAPSVSAGEIGLPLRVLDADGALEDALQRHVNEVAEQFRFTQELASFGLFDGRQVIDLSPLLRRDGRRLESGPPKAARLQVFLHGLQALAQAGRLRSMLLILRRTKPNPVNKQ